MPSPKDTRRLIAARSAPYSAVGPGTTIDDSPAVSLLSKTFEGGSLSVGDIIDVWACGTVAKSGAAAITLELHYGGTGLVGGGGTLLWDEQGWTTTSANAGAEWGFEGRGVVRTVGSAGVIVFSGTAWLFDTTDALVGAADWRGGTTVASSLNMTADSLVSLTGNTASAADTFVMEAGYIEHRRREATATAG